MRKEIRRGDIYYIEKDVTVPEIGSEQKTGRPAIIVSNDANNQFSEVVEVVYLTTSRKKKPLPTHVPIKCTKQASTALCEQVSSISILRLGEYWGRCSGRELEKVDHALGISLGLVPLKTGGRNKSG